MGKRIACSPINSSEADAAHAFSPTDRKPDWVPDRQRRPWSFGRDTAVRPSATHDVDALFRPTRLVREAVARVAAKANVSENWLNDAVKGFLSPRAEFDRFLELPHLKVFVARPRYLLAMKCAAMRLGEEFHDLDDVRYLLRYLNTSSAEDALAIVTQYFDETELLPKTRLVLEELFEN